MLKKFAKNDLNESESRALEQMIARGQVELSDLDLFNEVIISEEVESSDFDFTKLDHQFYQYLSAADRSPRQPLSWNFSLGWKLAASFTLGVIFLWIGIEITNSSGAGHASPQSADMMVKLLEAENVGDKIHLVSSAKSNPNIDAQIIDALLFSLVNDESNNVRLACIETLSMYATNPSVRAGLIKAIPHQQSPTVFTRLADAIRLSGQPIGNEKMRALIDKDLPAPLLRSIEDALPTL